MEDIRVPVTNGEISVWHRPAEDDASTVVLVHGLSGNSRWWGAVIDDLPETLGVIALDVRGRGESVDAPAPYDLRTIAGDIKSSLDLFGIDRAIVVGYSMGGWVAALFGVESPERVERILLLDGGLPLPRDPDAEADEIIEALVGPSLGRLGVDFESMDAYLDHWKSHPAFERHWDDSMGPALTHELVPEGDHYRVRANPEAIRVGAREITMGGEANGASSKLNVPTHLIVVERGTMDQPGGMTPLDVAENAATANPELTMQYLPGLNHYTLILGRGAPVVAAAIAVE